MKNYIAEGDRFPVVVSGSPVVSGQLIAVGDVIGVAVTGGAIGDTISVMVAGTFEVPKDSGAVTQGQKLYFNPTSGKLTTAADNGGSPATAYVWAGWAYVAAASGDATVKFRMKVS